MECMGALLKTRDERILQGRRIFEHLVRCNELPLHFAHKSPFAVEHSTGLADAMSHVPMGENELIGDCPLPKVERLSL
jgi:hypothetical protein